MTDAPAGYTSGPTGRHTNGGAIAAPVCGLLSFTCCIPVVAAGLWFVITARKSIARSEGTEAGTPLGSRP